MDKKVDWDGKTQTVYVGEVSEQSSDQYSYLTEILPSVTNSGKTYKLKDKEKMEMGGKTYKTGFSVTGFGNFIYFNLDGKYTEITGEIGSMGTSNRENDLELFLDDKPYKTIKISGDKSPEKITIPVSGVNQVKFANNSNQGIYYLRFGLGDFRIK